MLNKINRIHNVGIFKEYDLDPNNHGDINFSKFNLVYGRNGTGKSTIVELLKSLSSNENSLIYSRKSLNTEDKQEVILTIDNDNYRFYNGWNKTYPNINIFGQKYINDNIFLADTITIDNRRNQFKLIIGESNIKITVELNKINEEIRNINKEIKRVETDIEKEIVGKTSINDFVRLETSSDISEVQTELEELIKNKENYNQITKIQNLRTLTRVEFPNINMVEFEKFITTNSNQLITNAEKDLKIYCENKQIDENWIKIGYVHTNDNKCPFCNQGLHNSDIFSVFKEYFNANLGEYSQKVTYYNEYIKSNFSNEKLLENRYMLEKNHNSFNEMAKYLLLPGNSVVNPDEIILKVSIFVDKLKSLIQRKNENLFNEASLIYVFTALKQECLNILESIKIYNITVDSINTGLFKYIENISKSNILKIEEQIEYHQNLLKRNSKEIEPLINLYLELTKKSKYFGYKRDNLKQELLKFDKMKIRNFDINLNRQLENFNLPYKIKYESPKYGSYGPEVDYYILIDKSKVKARVSKNKEIEQPNIKNTISEGEKYLLAFACFLACLDINDQIHNSIIVFDDPTNYCDMKNKALIAEQILQLSKENNQIFIFTHDNEFSKKIWDQSDGADITGLYIDNYGTSSQILTRDKYRLMNNKV